MKWMSEEHRARALFGNRYPVSCADNIVGTGARCRPAVGNLPIWKIALFGNLQSDWGALFPFLRSWDTLIDTLTPNCSLLP